MKNLLITLLAAAITFSSCTLKEVINPDGTAGNKSGSSSGSTSGTTNTGTLSDTYQPVTKGSMWTYDYYTGGTFAYTSSMVMTGDVTYISGLTFHNITVSDGQTTQAGFFYADKNTYTFRINMIEGTIVNVPYVRDDLDVNATWTTKVNENGNIHGVHAQFVATILQKGISKIVSGKTYNNVIHTKIDLQYDYGTGFTTYGTYNYYTAKGIGIIEVDSDVVGVTINQYLTGYNIK